MIKVAIIFLVFCIVIASYIVLPITAVYISNSAKSTSGLITLLPDLLLKDLTIPEQCLQTYRLAQIDVRFLTTFKDATNAVVAFIKDPKPYPNATVTVVHSTAAHQLMPIFKVDFRQKAMQINDIYLFLGLWRNRPTVDISEIINKIRSLKKTYKLSFMDNESGKSYAHIQDDGILEVKDSVLYRFNVDPWLNAVLEAIADNKKPILMSDINNHPELKISYLANYLWLIEKLRNFSAIFPSDKKKTRLYTSISIFKSLFENHCTDLNKVVAHVAKIDFDEFTLSEKNQLKEIFKTFLNNFSSVSTPQHLDHLVSARFYESALAEKILKEPPREMMKRVGQVSKGIIKLIQENRGRVDDYIFIDFLDRLSTPHLTMGTFAKQLTLEKVVDLLIANKPEQVVDIMLVHYIFMYDCFRHLKVYQELPESNELHALWNKNKLICKTALDKKKFDQYLYTSEIFKARGRNIMPSRNPIGHFSFLNENNAYSAHTGIIFNYYLPHFEKKPYEWRQDKFSTIPDFSTRYVQDTQKHEIPYVSGPSGMTTLLIPLSLLGGMLTTQQDFCYYLLAITAYLVEGGLHSIHEVLMVAQHNLNLLYFKGEHYAIKGEQIGNYGLFLDVFKGDPEVNAIRDVAFGELLSFFSNKNKEQLFETELRNYHRTLDPIEFITHLPPYTIDQFFVHEIKSKINKICACEKISEKNKQTYWILQEDLNRLKTERGLLNFKDVIIRKIPSNCLNRVEKQKILEGIDEKISTIKSNYDERLAIGQ